MSQQKQTRRPRDLTKSCKTRAKLTRRNLLASGAGAVAASVVSWPLILIPGKAKASERLVFVSWGGRFSEAIEEAYTKPFTKETGIEVLVAGGPDVAKVRAMVMTGSVEWDLMIPVPSWLTAGEKEGLWEPIDYSIVDMSGTFAGAKRDYAIGFGIIGGGMCWHQERNGAPGKHPETWPEFFDYTRIPGRRGLRTRPTETLELALLGDGVSPDALYPLDVDRAFASLDRLKPHVSNWIEHTPKTISLVQNNECDFTYTYHNRVFAARKAGIPIDFSFNATIAYLDWISVIKGTRNRDAAMQLLAFIMRPKQQAIFGNLQAYPPAKLEAVELVDPEVRKFFPDVDSPNNANLSIDYWADHQMELEKRYKEWLIT